MKKNLILKSIISACALLFAVVLVFVGIASVNVNADNYNTITVTPSKKSDLGHAKADGNSVTLTFKGSFSGSETATVHYATYDMSAVADAGDYTSTEGTIILSASKPSINVSIAVTKTSFAVYRSGTTTRCFGFASEVVSKGNYKIADSCKDITCDLNYEYLYNAESCTDEAKNYLNVSDIATFSVYDDVASRETYDATDTNTITTWYNLFAGSNVINKWYNYYVKTGLAKAYAGIEILNLNDNGPQTGEFDIEMYEYTNYNNDSTKRVERLEIYPHFDTLKNVNVNFQYQHNDGYYLENRYTYSQDCYDGYTYLDGEKKMFYGVNLDTSSIDNMYMKVKMINDDTPVFKCDYEMRANYTLTQTLIDRTGPEIIGAYVDQNGMAANGGKFTVALRFNEPVQDIARQTPEGLVHSKIKGHGTGDDVILDYAGGSGTDTLYYQIDASKMSSTSLMTSFNVTDLMNQYCIFDYGNDNDNNSRETVLPNTIEKLWITHEINNLSVDFSRPEFTTSTTPTTSTPTNVRTVSVDTESSEGTIYYIWTRSNELIGTDPSLYPNSYSYYKSTVSKHFEITSNNTYIMKKDYDPDNYPDDTSFVKVDDNLNGEWFLHILVIGANGRIGITNFDSGEIVLGATSERGFSLDNIPPTISDVAEADSDTSTLQERVFTGVITDLPVGTDLGISTVVLNYGDDNEISYYILDGATNSNFTYDTETGKFTLKIPASAVGVGTGEGQSLYGKFKLTLKVTDTCGNISEAVFKSSKGYQYIEFDVRENFDVSEDTSGADIIVESETNGEKGILIDADTELVFTSQDTSAEDFRIDSIIFAGTTYTLETSAFADGKVTLPDEIKDCLTITYDDSAKSITVKPLKSGSFRIRFSQSTKVSKLYGYYFTTALEDDTVNYVQFEDENYPINYVYQLGSTSYYSIPANDGATITKYNNSSSLQSFSTQAKAYEYIKFCEYQDLYLLHIDEAIANTLNIGGQSAYTKASGETETAVAGQYWIRYKVSSWNNTTEAYGWAYYYYGNSVTYNSINSGLFSDNLKSAINAVTQRIFEQGKYVYLTSSEYLNSFGQTKLTSDQIHPTDETVTKTLSGSAFASTLTYYGDTGIFSNDYSYTDENGATVSIKYLMHFLLSMSEDTRIFYASTENAKQNIYTEVVDGDGKYLDSFIGANADDTYTIIEMDTNGIRKFIIRVDKAAPVLEAKYDDFSSSEVVYFTHAEYDGGSFSRKKLALINIADDDKYAYVTLYKTNGYLVGSYLVSDVVSKGIIVASGSYKMVVSDRYGNSTTLTLNLSDEDFTIEEKVVDELYVLLKCTREPEEISKYEVYYNDSLYTSDYSQSLRLDESGTYHVIAQDIYGNTFDDTFTFQRKLPEVTWKYLDDDYYVTFDSTTEDETQPMKMEALSDTQYGITTAVKLQFYYEGRYSYEFEDGNPDISAVENNGTKVTINSTSGWKLKIWYTDYPDVYVEYICVTDNTPPTVYGSYDSNSYEYEGQEALDTAAASGLDDFTELTPSTINYEKTGTTHNYVRSGDAIHTDQVVLYIKDDNGIRKNNGVEIQLTKIVLDEDTNTNVEKTETSYADTSSGTCADITLTEYGTYKITAYDVFGNATVFTFVNSNDTFGTKTIDGKVNTDTVSYGNTSYITKYNGTGTVMYAVTTGVDKATTEYYIFSMTSQKLTRLHYIVQTVTIDGVDTKVAKLSSMNEIINLADGTSYKSGTWVKINNVDSIMNVINSDPAEILKNSYKLSQFVTNFESSNYFKYYTESGQFEAKFGMAYASLPASTDEQKAAKKEKLTTVATEYLESLASWNDVYAMYDGEGFSIKFLQQDERITLDSTFMPDNGANLMEFHAMLSDELTDVALEYKTDTESVIKTNQNNEYIKVNSEFKLSSTIDSLVARIRLCYSKTKDFKNYSTIYQNGDLSAYSTVKDGFYAIQITNKFGNTLTYYIEKSNTMSVGIDVLHLDNSEVSYLFRPGDHVGTINSNKSITITLYEASGSFALTKSGTGSEVSVTVQQSTDKTYCYVVISYRGTYDFVVKDDYGNQITGSIYINDANIQYNSSWLSGFSDTALTEGYTKDIVVLDRYSLETSKIAQVSYVYNGTETVIYSTILQNYSSIKSSLSNDSGVNNPTGLKTIGEDGSGVYTVVFSDKCGNKVSKEVHYAAESTLLIQTNHRSDTTYKDYTIVDAEDYGVWSNNSVKLSSSVTKYEMTITNPNGNLITDASANIEFNFDNISGNGIYTYKIYYHDEYGWVHNFDINLLRRDLTVSLAKDTPYKTIDGVITVNQDFVIDYSADIVIDYAGMSEIYVVYYIGEDYSALYEEGSTLVKDGVYSFTAVDVAYNVYTYTVVKDTSVVYTLTDTSAEKEIVSGAVVNSNSVEFASGITDTSYIYSVLKDGVEVTIPENNIFTESGKWELLIRDEMDNEDYFCFYIVSHPLSTFTYEVPYGYTISEIWQYSSQGLKNTYLDKVDVENGFTINVDGTYSVKVKSLISNTLFNFSFVIDNTPPSVSLVGVNEGETTRNDVTISGLQEGDTVYIYCDDSLSSTYSVESDGDTPTISTGGVYKVVVENQAGVSTTLTFTRAKLTNGAGNAVIIIAISAVCIGLFMGIVFRKHSRVDK